MIAGILVDVRRLAVRRHGACALRFMRQFIQILDRKLAKLLPIRETSGRIIWTGGQQGWFFPHDTY